MTNTYLSVQQNGNTGVGVDEKRTSVAIPCASPWNRPMELAPCHHTTFPYGTGSNRQKWTMTAGMALLRQPKSMGDSLGELTNQKKMFPYEGKLKRTDVKQMQPNNKDSIHFQRCTHINHVVPICVFPAIPFPPTPLTIPRLKGCKTDCRESGMRSGNCKIASYTCKVL